jgi:protein-disulfide isomerase
MAKEKRRKLSKAQAREEALRRKKQRQITWAVVGVVAVAAFVVILLVAMSGGGEVTAQSGDVPAQSGDVPTQSGELDTPVPPLRDDVETGLTAEGYPYRGSADAPVTVVEFSDYNCPHCRRYNVETAPLIDDELVASGQVRYVIQPFTLWDESLPVAEAAACARDQDRFWEFHHRMYENQGRFSLSRPPSRELLREWAEASGLDFDEFEVCIDQGRHREEVIAGTRDAKERLGVNSTPTVFVNGVKTTPTFNAIRNAVQAAQGG